MSFIADLQKLVEESPNPLLGVNEAWTRVRLRDVASILNGYAFKSNQFATDRGTPLIRIRDLETGSTITRYQGDYDPRYLIQRGDILVGMDGDFKVAEWSGEPALLNQRVCKITVNEDIYDARFLRFALPGYLDAIHEATSSQTVKHLSSRDIAEIPLPRPPLPEQRRIVEKVEALLARVAAARERVQRAHKQLSRIRRGLLNAAYEGSLIGATISDHVDFGEICTELRGGNSATSQRATTAWPVLKSSAVRPFKIDYADLNYLGSEKDRSQNSEILEGDLLITRLSGSLEFVGNCAVVRTRPETPLQIPDRIFRARLQRDFDQDYVEIMFNSPEARKPLEETAKSSAGHQRISLDDIRHVRIPRLSPGQQAEVVRLTSALLKLTNAIEKRLGETVLLRERVEATILAKAFAGELVPTEAELARPENRDYEPASALFERMRREPAIKNGVKKPRRR